MAKIAIGFGVVLILLGAWGFFGTGSAHPTALIPAYFGLALVVCGVLANSPDEKRRINPQNPMRQNRWRKMKQQVPRGSTPLKGTSGPIAGASPAESVPSGERPQEPS